MQDRVVNSSIAVSRSTSSTAGSNRAALSGDPNPRSASTNLLSRLLGLGFWSAICVILGCCLILPGSAAQTVDPNNILLDFSASWCGPCQQMGPIVSKLERQGLPIRKVDVDVEKELTSRYKVESLPCFVLIASGREIERISGRTDEKHLRALMMRLPKQNHDDGSVDKSARNHGQLIPTSNSGVASSGDRKLFPKILPLFAKNNDKSNDKSNDLKLTPTDPSDTVRGQSPNLETNADRFASDPLSASTRIRIADGRDIRFGSGTIIESESGHSVILTCGHIFRGLGKNAVVEVDYYPGGKSKRQTFVGRILRFDLESDLGLLTIPSQQRLPVMKIGASDGLSVKDRVVSIGCGGGESPTSEKHVVTAVNRYEGPDNVECDGVPEQGRSGGGLFRGSELVGVCIAADPKDKRGIYTGLKPAVQLLGKSNLGHLAPTSLASGESVAHTEPAKGKTPIDSSLGTNDVSVRERDDEFAEIVREVTQENERLKFDSADYVGAEIVCIVRPKTPGALSRIVVVNQATSRFVDDLLRDSNGGSRLDSKATVRTTPRKVPARKSSEANVAMSNPQTEKKKPAVKVKPTEPDRPVETSFEPQRFQRTRVAADSGNR